MLFDILLLESDPNNNDNQSASRSTAEPASRTKQRQRAAQQRAAQHSTAELRSMMRTLPSPADSCSSSTRHHQGWLHVIF